jgi:uncharacterized membrane protein
MSRLWRSEWPSWVLLVGMFVVAAIAWPRVPAQIPVHWGIDGTPDRYGGRVEGLLLLPLIAVGLYLLLRFLPRFDPRRANYALFSGSYDLIRFATLVLLVIVYAVSLLIAAGYALDMTQIVPVLVGGLFIVIGSVLGKLRQVWFVGIRTPWTLSSARSWNKTHRLGGWVFLVAGLLMALSGLLRQPIMLLVIIGALVVAMLGLVWYSYLIWREDEGAQPPVSGQPNGHDLI